jgi:hypothetical protein
MVFGVGLDYFFTEERKRHVVSIVRKSERLRSSEISNGNISYHSESLDFKATERKLNGFYAEFQIQPFDKLKAHQHAGVELLWLLKGKLELSIGSEIYTWHLVTRFISILPFATNIVQPTRTFVPVSSLQRPDRMV